MKRELTIEEMQFTLDNRKTVKHCMVCGKQATLFTGNVLKEDEIVKEVFAGFCSREHEIKSQSDVNGCFGVWRECMGIESAH